MIFIKKFDLLDRKLSLNIISLFFINTFKFLANIVTLPYLIKSYGVEKWGEIVIFQIVINYLIWITEWSFNLHSSKLISINDGNNKEENKIFSITLSAQFLLLLITLLLLNLYGFIFADIKQLYLYINLILVGNFLQPYWYLNGKEKIYENSLFQLFNKIILTLLILILINKNSSIQEYFLFMGISSLITGTFFMLRVKIYYKINFIFTDYKKTINFLRSSFKLYISEIWSTLSNSFIPILIKSTLGNLDLGIYNISERIKSILVQAIHPLTHSIFPRISKKYYLNKTEGNLSLLKILKIGLILITIIFIITNIFINQIVSYFSSEYSSEIIPIFRILLFSFLLNVMTEIFISQYFVPNNMYNFINNLQIIKLIFYLFFITTGIYLLGLEGAALGAVVSEALSIFIIINKFKITRNHKVFY